MVLLLAVALVIGGFFAVKYVTRKIMYQQFVKNFRMITPTGRVYETKSVSINDCKVDPSIAHVRLEGILKYVNNDERSHTIYFKEGHYTVSAKSDMSINLAFLKTPGAKSYDCDSVKHVGIVVVAQQAISASSSPKVNKK